MDWTLLNLFSSLYHCGLDPPSLLFSLLWCDCSAFIQNSRSSTLNFFPATQTVGREGEGWGNDGHCGLLLFTPCHSVLSYPGPRVKLDTLAGYWFSLYTLQMSLLKMSLDYRLILTAWEILEIDRQTLVGVGGISFSSFSLDD